MAARIADRLDQMHRTRDANIARHSTGTALVLVKHQVIDDAFRETNIRLVAVTGLRRARSTARSGMDWPPATASI